MKIIPSEHDMLQLDTIGKDGFINEILVNNEILPVKPDKTEPLEVQIQWKLSKPLLTGKEKFITSESFKSILGFWDKSKNQQDGIFQDTHDCYSNKPVWWNNSKCGHSYKLSVTCRLDNEPDCKLCHLLKEPSYYFISKNWNSSKNGDLYYMPSFTAKFHWKCDICNNTFKKSINQYHKDSSCPNCNKTKNEKIKLEEKQRINARKLAREVKRANKQPKNRIWNSSYIERRIYYLMKCMFGDEVLNGHKLNKIEMDIFIPSLNAAIEYDGVYWHKNKIEQDKRKNGKLESLNINLIRVRESGLEKTRTYDIIYDYKKGDMNSLFIELTSFIKSNCKLTQEQTSSIGKLMATDLNKIPIPKEYLSTVQLEKSIGFKHPHLLDDWNDQLNVDADLFKMTETSTLTKSIFWWKCHMCNFEFQESAIEMIEMCGCPNCGYYHP